MRLRGTATALLMMILVLAPEASAAPFTVTSVLTGDGRPANPDLLNVDVTISGDTDSNVTNWVVDLDMAATHPDAALHEFYFNLVGTVADYTVNSFSPASWSLTGTNVTNAQGSGSANFMFEVSGPNNTVTNSTNLTFSVLRLAGNFAPSLFTGAADGCSNDEALGCGQLGAHIGSLESNTNTDSGFALGDYSSTVTIQAVPEPMSLTLLATGLAGLVARKRRRR